MTNQEIITQLQKAVIVHSITDKTPFRVRAYQQAIDSISQLDIEAQSLSTAELTALPGIGKEIATKISDLAHLGSSPSLEKLFATIPESVFVLTDIPTIGPLKAYKLAQAFNLTNATTARQELRDHALAGDIARIPGFGLKSQEQILHNLHRQKPKAERMRLDKADTIANQIISYISLAPQLQRVEALGSIRRREETVGDIDIGVATNHPKELYNHLSQWSKVKNIAAAGKNVIRIQLHNNIQVDIKYQSSATWGSLLQHFTGSKQHNIKLRERAQKMGMSVSEHGIKYQGRMHRFSKESDLYSFLNMPYIPPELRSGEGEVSDDAASYSDLVEIGDILGDTHTHTDFHMVSSHDHGEDPVKILKICSDKRYQWVFIGDHNPALSQYDTLSNMNTILDQRQQYIEQKYSSWKRRENDVDIFSALEVDIRADGQLALPEKSLSRLDVVIVALHSSLTMPRSKMESRLLKAISHPCVHILAHPTNRLILKRPTIDVDWERILKACQAHQVAIEINAQPARLDFPDSLCKLGKQIGVKFALGTDAHTQEHMQLMTYGVSVARRANLKKSDIINSYSTSQIRSWLKSKEVSI